MPNMPYTDDTLRESFQDFAEKGMWQGEDEYTKNFRVEDIATFWLSKFNDYQAYLIEQGTKLRRNKPKWDEEISRRDVYAKAIENYQNIIRGK